MKGRNTQVARIYRILSILEGAPQGLSAGDLVIRLQDRGFDVGKRTVYRDLEALRAARFPLEEKGKDESYGARWTLEKTTKLNNYLIFSARELLALYFARNVLSPLKDTPFYADLISTFTKIEEKISGSGQEYLDEIGRELIFEAGPRWGLGIDPDTLETVRSACAERQKLRFSYKSVNKPDGMERTVGPQFIYFAKGSLYLVAEDLESGTNKIYAIPRMTDAKMLEDPFDGVLEDPEKYFESSFGVYHGANPVSVVLQASQLLANYIKERRWHPSQRVISRGDGSVEVHFDVAITPELIHWIMGFGAEMLVLKPIELVDRIKEETEKLINLYKKTG
ncbi:MAG: WYL domain-containing protein [Deltaproteobacteria bacterium]|nr:WYL domain-containing protein [Deltaproteobacteria bacterium]